MFDFLEKQYDENRIENGAWLHFTDDEGELLYLDGPERKEDGVTKGGKKPCRALVRSVLSSTYDKLSDDRMKRMSDRKLKSEEQRRQAAMLQIKQEPAKVCSLVLVKLENVSVVQPGEVRPSPADIMVFASKTKNEPWVTQINNFAADHRNYGGTNSEAVEEGKGAAAD